MKRITEILNRVYGYDNIYLEDLNIPLKQYNEMAAYTGQDTGIIVNNTPYNTVIVPKPANHSYRIKFSVHPTNTNEEYLVSIYKKDNNYIVLYNSSIEKEVKKASKAITLAVAFYEKNFDLINNFEDKLSSGQLVFADEIKGIADKWEKVSPKETVTNTITYKVK